MKSHFTRFQQSIASYSLPERFTFPFYYQPHPLCELAVQKLQSHLKTQTDWQHNFGLEGDSENAIGKMFGVLLVKNRGGEIGYLSAFSGKLAESNHQAGFVPPVFDMLEEGGFFRVGQDELKTISILIKKLELNPNIELLKLQLNEQQQEADSQIAAHRVTMIEGRKSRKQQREQAQGTEGYIQLKEALGKQSVHQKNQLRDLQTYWADKISQVQIKISEITFEISELKDKRKVISAKLQQQLFEHYLFLNNKGIEKNVCDLFKDHPQKTPPAGAGECAAPKLLHYAFKHDLTPLALAEFWWGQSPKSEIRQHSHFYAACQGKCQPILAHMLEGIEMDDNPLLINPAEGKDIDILYEDDVMVVINKPEEFLSVPGKNIEDSVYLRMKQRYPEATGSLIVHRLDMSTSGLMVIALSSRAHKHLQKQFINRTVQKRYIAVLDGVLEQEEGQVDLPLRVDLDDRPRQLVCYEYGKVAQTRWHIIKQENNQTMVYFYPKTGRTHQLRVHAAHINGLNMPIVGDDLYGYKANRLHLHAEFLTLNHPITKELMHFQVDANFQ